MIWRILYGIWELQFLLGIPNVKDIIPFSKMGLAVQIMILTTFILLIFTK